MAIYFFPKCIIKVFQSIGWDKARRDCLETKDGRNQGFLPDVKPLFCCCSSVSQLMA